MSDAHRPGSGYRAVLETYRDLMVAYGEASAAEGGPGLPVGAYPIGWAQRSDEELWARCEEAERRHGGQDDHVTHDPEAQSAMGVELIAELAGQDEAPSRESVTYLVRWLAHRVPRRSATVLRKLRRADLIDALEDEAFERFAVVAAEERPPAGKSDDEIDHWATQARMALDKNTELLTLDQLLELVERLAINSPFAEEALRRDGLDLEGRRLIVRHVTDRGVRAALLRDEEARTDPVVRAACLDTRDRRVIWRLLKEARGEELKMLFGRALKGCPEEALGWLMSGQIDGQYELGPDDLAPALSHSRRAVREKAILALSHVRGGPSPCDDRSDRGEPSPPSR